jgi:hypothetical protein
VTDNHTARSLTLLLGSATLLGLSACGGGGSGDVTAAGTVAVTTAAAPTAATAPAATAPTAPAATAPAATAPAAAAPAEGTAVPATATADASASSSTGAARSDAGVSTLGVAVPSAQSSTAMAATAAPTVGTAAAPSAAPAPSATVAAIPASNGAVPTLGDCQLFPANAIFNTRIDDAARFPVHPQSDQWLDVAGRNLPFGADWGVNTNAAAYGTYWGMPINVIDSSGSDWPAVSFDFSTSGVSWEQGYPFKSDCAVSNGSGYGIARDCTSVPATHRQFPFPRDGQIVNENGACDDPNSCGDRHVLVVERGACRLWESFFSYKLSGQWYSMATAAWDLNSLALRPDNWASGDAAGLPITPLLVKAAEANAGEIRHALRVNFRDAALSLEHVWPARFAAGADNPGAIPFGALLRLRGDFVIPDTWTTQAKAIATAAKRYGMYVADNGGDFNVLGEPNASWDPTTLQQLKAITMNSMEFVDLKSVTGDPRFSRDSMAASW